MAEPSVSSTSNLAAEPASAVADYRKAAIFTAFSIVYTVFCPFIYHCGILSFPGFGCLAVLCLSISRFRGVRHGIPCPEVFCLATSFLSGWYFTQILPGPRTPAFDELLWVFDANFGYPELPLVKFVLNYPLAHVVVRMCYLGLPLAGTLVYLALPNVIQIRRKYFIACGLGALIMAFYAVCPAAGPYYLFVERLPWHVPAVTHPHVRILGDVSLNCAPSGHVGWALLLMWFAFRYCGRITRAATAAFLFLTCLGTLGLGEHYVIDLVLSVPYACGLWTLVERDWRRGIVNWTVVLVWLVALREGWPLPLPSPAVWLLSAATIATPWWSALRVAPRWTYWRIPAPAYARRSS